MNLKHLWLLALLVTTTPVKATDTFSEYRPEVSVSGVLRSWGADGMMHLMTAWEKGFRTFHPAIQFDDHLINTSLAMPGLSTGVADLGLIGREAYREEIIAYERFHHHLPLAIQIGTGAFNAATKKTFPPVVFVNRDNPIEKLTLQQLDGIFGSPRTGGWDVSGMAWKTESGRGPELSIRTWGQLGLGGEWKERAIHPYGFVVGPRSGVAHFFAERIFQGGDKWTENLTEVWYQEKGDGTTTDLNTVMAQSIGSDRYGIGYGASQFAIPGIKTVALAYDKRGPYVQATRDSIVSRSYPLSRPVYIFVNRKPGQPLDPKVKEFLRYVLSNAGQEAIQHEGEYLPLSPALASEQLKLLD